MKETSLLGFPSMTPSDSREQGVQVRHSSKQASSIQWTALFLLASELIELTELTGTESRLLITHRRAAIFWIMSGSPSAGNPRRWERHRCRGWEKAVSGTLRKSTTKRWDLGRFKVKHLQAQAGGHIIFMASTGHCICGSTGKCDRLMEYPLLAVEKNCPLTF